MGSELPLPELEPMPLLLGVLVEPLDEPLLLGVLLLGELLDEPLLLGELEAPPLLEPLELDLKCASHSVREIWPSLFVSTVVKLGALEEAPLLALPPLAELLGVDDELLGVDELLLGVDELLLGVDELPLLELPLELLPVALGEDLSLDVEDEPELCAMETLASAKSAAAVAVVISFNFIW